MATDNPLWREWVERGAASILNSGAPETRTPGFWNNVGQCCGDAGVLELLCELAESTGKEMYIDAARRFGDDLIAPVQELARMLRENASSSSPPRRARNTLEILLGALLSQSRDCAKVSLPLPRG